MASKNKNPQTSSTDDNSDGPLSDLLSGLPMEEARHRKAVEDLAHLLIANAKAGPDDCLETVFDFAVFRLGNLLLDGTAIIKRQTLDRDDDITLYVGARLDSGTKWEAAVREAMSTYKLSRPTITRALAKRSGYFAEFMRWYRDRTGGSIKKG